QGPPPDQHVPGPGPPAGEPRPAGDQEGVVPSRARPLVPRPVRVGPRPRVLRGRRAGPEPKEAPGGTGPPARRLLPDDRVRVHAHPGARAEALDPGAGGGGQPRALEGGPAPRPRATERGRVLRAVPPFEIRGAQAIQLGGRGEPDPDARGPEGGG